MSDNSFDLRKAAKNLHDLQKVGEALGLHAPPADVSSQAGQHKESEMDNRDFARSEGLYLKFAEPLMEPHTPIIMERVNGDCTVSQFIIARDEAYKLVEQMREFLHVAAAPSAGGGQEGLRETLRDIRCVADTLYMNLKSAAIWNSDSFHKESLEQLFQRFKDAITRVVKLEAALLPPASKPPAEPLDLTAAKLRVGLGELLMKLPYIKAVRNAEVGQERFVARDDVITALHEYAKNVRRASLERESK